MKTCRPAMATMTAPSMRLKLKILRSVLRTVLEFRFSRVRKYFCWRVSDETRPEINNSASSTSDNCSLLAPAFWGSAVRVSSSTYFVTLVCLHPLVPARRGPLHPRSCIGRILFRKKKKGELTVISISTIFSVNVETLLSKQNRYSPTSVAVNAKSPCRSFSPSRIVLSCPAFLLGPVTT